MKGHEVFLKSYHEHQVARGRAIKMSLADAIRIFGEENVSIAAEGFVAKGFDDRGEEDFRVIHDGTNIVFVNHAIRVPNHTMLPSSTEQKRVLRDVGEDADAWVGLVGDMKEAHQAVPVVKTDWPRLAARAEPEGDLYLATCGTYGISSAGEWWSRVAAALVRYGHYLLGPHFFIHLLI